MQKEGRKGSKSDTCKKPHGIANEDGWSMATIRSVDALPQTKKPKTAGRSWFCEVLSSKNLMVI